MYFDTESKDALEGIILPICKGGTKPSLSLPLKKGENPPPPFVKGDLPRGIDKNIQRGEGGFIIVCILTVIDP